MAFSEIIRSLNIYRKIDLESLRIMEEFLQIGGNKNGF